MNEKPLTEADILSRIARDGSFYINPLAYRNRKTLRLLEAMRKRGTLDKTFQRNNWVEYTLHES